MGGDPPRRVVTGLDDQGRSCIAIDGPSEAVIWQGDAIPFGNGGNADTGSAKFSFPKTEGESRFIFVDLKPGYGRDGVWMHATDTIDFIVVMTGAITLITETGESLVRAGDAVVDRGVLHGWRNDGDVVARLFIVFLKADPVGRGATI